MKKEFKLRSLLYSMLMMIAMVAVSFSMTACGDDDEEEGDGPIAWLKFDGKKYDVKNLLFLHETGTTNRYNFEVITDKGTMGIHIHKNHWGDTNLLDVVDDGDYSSWTDWSYTSVVWTFTNDDDNTEVWYVDNDPNDGTHLAESGSFIEVSVTTQIDIKGKIFYSGNGNNVSDGKSHTIEVRVRGNYAAG